MSDDTKLTISDRNNAQPVFVNQVIGQGILNGVVNVTFGTFGFTPTNDGKVDPDMVISSRLRMDITCAQQLHAALGSILEQALKPSNATTH